MKRGEIYFINDEPYNKNRRGEMKANHPAVIVSSDELNEDADVRTVEVVYMTTLPQLNIPTHVAINSSLKPSTLLCEQVHTVSKDRLSQIKLGQLTLNELEAMDAALAFSVGLTNEREETEPSPDEYQQIIKEMARNGELYVPEEEKPTLNIEAALIRAEAERDTYKQLYTDLLVTITKGARA